MVKTKTTFICGVLASNSKHKNLFYVDKDDKLIISHEIVFFISV